MYYGLIDECLMRMLNVIGIEYAIEWYKAPRWSIESEVDELGRETKVNMGKLLIIISSSRKAATAH